MIILRFTDDVCADCRRPTNAGGYHNAGCKVSPRRFCALCESQHDNGDDVHRGSDGLYCSSEAATRRMIDMRPGWTRAQCEDEVARRLREVRLDLDAYNWLKADHLAERVIMAAVRGAQQ